MSTTESHLSSVASSMDSLAVIRGSPGVKQRSALGKQVTDSMRVEVGSKMVLIQEMGGRLSASRPSITVTPSSSQEIGLDEAEMEQDESR